MEKVLRKMAENDLFVKPEKCVWNIREVGFLEVIIGLDGIKIKKEKIQRVVDWLVLRSVKNMQKFLELTNYYRQFVKDFARVAKLLHEMIKKDVKWNWREKWQKAFEELKERFILEPVLLTPDLCQDR